MAAAADPAPRLQPGDEARPFSLPASDGKTVALADYLGHKTVVLAFFPKEIGRASCRERVC